MLKQEFTIILYTENHFGLLSRIADMFSRRRINIESMNIAASEVEGIHRFTIGVIQTEEVVMKLSLQLEKQVEILKSLYHTNRDIIWQEQALYKIDHGVGMNSRIENLLHEYGAREVARTEAYSVFETTGLPATTDAMLKGLAPCGLSEFVKGGKIAVLKSGNAMHATLMAFESAHPNLANDE